MEGSADNRKPDCGFGSKRIHIGRYPDWPRPDGGLQNGQSGLIKEAALVRSQQQQPRRFEIRAEWDGEAGVWWCSNGELPLTTEAPTFEQLVSRVLDIAPSIVAENGLAAPGDEIEVHVIAERVQSVPVMAAA